MIAYYYPPTLALAVVQRNTSTPPSLHPSIHPSIHAPWRLKLADKAKVRQYRHQMLGTSNTSISTISSSTTRLVLFYCGGEGIGTLPRPDPSLQHLLPGSDAQLFCSSTAEDGTSTRMGFTFRTHCIAPLYRWFLVTIKTMSFFVVVQNTAAAVKVLKQK